MEETIFAFDLGTTSIGECVRRGKEVLHLGSLLIPAEAADISTQAQRRRQHRTRLAHRARQDWWRECARQAGIEVLETRQPTKDNPGFCPDPRMLKEFPAPGEKVIYTSSLLRIALLQGKQLEGWQVFKAIWSALQHRGYDSKIPWGSRNGKKDDDEQKNQEAVGQYSEELKRCFGSRTEYHLPCYYEAFQIGLWSPEDPDNLGSRLGSNPSPARNRDSKIVKAVAPRELVEKELLLLLEMAAGLFPALKGRERFILYGPAEQAYASVNLPQYREYRGRDWEWQGLLGQKVPRFDNRIIGKCRLIGRLNVCRADDLLSQDVSFLVALKNMRYFDADNRPRALTAGEINDFFQRFRDKRRITKVAWKKLVQERFGGVVNPTQEKVEAPKTGGRSSFSRPALRILKELLLSGESPRQLYRTKTENLANRDPNRGLVKEDYEFLLRMPAEWENFAVPDQRELERDLTPEAGRERMEKLINSINNSVVRHRLRAFVKRLEYLQRRFGRPDRLVIEFVRDANTGFMGEKRKKEYLRVQKDNRQSRENAREEAAAAGLSGETAILKVLLLKEQGGADIYPPFASIGVAALSTCEIDHIVPVESGGSDAFINKVLTLSTTNRLKGKRTPYEWLSQGSGWREFVERIKESKLNSKKKELLVSEKALELDEKYSNLAATAYIAKLTQRLASLYFNWPQQTKGAERRVLVANGAYTARIRRQYKLDRLLYPHQTQEEFAALVESGKLEEKNRDNSKHHALDALVISCWPYFAARRPAPAWFHGEFCGRELEKVIPRPLVFNKSGLEETMYGRRTLQQDGETQICYTSRFGKGTRIEEYRNIEKARKYVPSILDARIRRDLQQKLDSTPQPSQAEWESFLDAYFCGSKPVKLRKIASRLNPRGVDEYTPVVGKMAGQYHRGKVHKGQVVYRDQRGRWRVEPVYAFESPYLKIAAARARYGRVFFFRSGQLVEVLKDCKVKAGIYRLATIQSNGQVKLNQSDGAKYINPIPNVNDLMENGRMRSFKNPA